jgi:hypothetical protein
MRDKMQKEMASAIPVEIEAKVAKPKVAAKKKSKKVVRTHGLYAEAAKYARKIGAIVRIDKVKKVDAIRRVIADGELPITEQSMSAMMNPSYLGLDLYNRAFRGTKYVKQA